MISLKEYLTEGILDIEDNLDKSYIKTQIEEFIKENYWIKGQLKMNSVNGIYMVDCTNDVVVKNKDIKSLTNGFFEWGEVNGFFKCSYCDKLQSLEGAPKKVDKSFYCVGCNSLQSLEGAPEKVNRDFYCNVCISLKSLKGAPKEVKRDFYCFSCKKQFTKEDVEKVCKVKKCIYV